MLTFFFTPLNILNERCTHNEHCEHNKHPSELRFGEQLNLFEQFQFTDKHQEHVRRTILSYLLDKFNAARLAYSVRSEKFAELNIYNQMHQNNLDQALRIYE